MIYLYWLGAFIVVTPLILGLPFLSRNRTYRVATLFAGMNAGIIILHFFIFALRWDPGSTYLNELHIFFTTSIPVFYIASLIIGSILIPNYYLKSSTRLVRAFATFSVIIGSYLAYVATGLFIWILTISINEGFPSSEIFLEAAKNVVIKLSHPDLSLVSTFLIAAFIALNGTDAAIRISDAVSSPENEKIE